MKSNDSPKILIVTIPLRPIPTDFPPMGSLSVITALKKAGFNNTEFYDIDYLRPALSDVFNYIELFYNPKRKHGKNGMLSPVDFERQQYVKLQGV